MADSARRGFVPSRSQTGLGSGSLRSKLYETSTNLVSPIGVGDPVAFSAGYVQRLTTALSSAFVGVVRACYDSNKKPLTHRLPTNAAYLNASTAGFVDVVDDPNTVFVVECATSVGPSNLGGIGTVNVSSLNSATGISRAHIAGVTAADADGLFKVIGLAPSELATSAAGSPANKVEVVPLLHFYKRN